MKLPGEFVPLSFNKYSYICSYVFAHLRSITFKFGNFINFKTLFPVVSMDFPQLVYVRDGPLENLWGEEGRAKYKKNIRAREN